MIWMIFVILGIVSAAFGLICLIVILFKDNAAEWMSSSVIASLVAGILLFSIGGLAIAAKADADQRHACEKIGGKMEVVGTETTTIYDSTLKMARPQTVNVYGCVKP